MRTNLKKTASIFVTMLLLVVACFAPAAHAAEPRASYYLRSYTIDISKDSSNTVYVDVTVVGTNPMDDIGGKTVYLLEKGPNDTSWSNVKTFSYTSYPDMMGHDKQVYYFYVTYPGKEGYTYKATAAVYAGKDGNGDTRAITSVEI